MKSTVIGTCVVAILAVLGSGGCQGGAEAKRAGELKRLAAGADWWEHQYVTMQALDGLRAKSRPAEENLRATEEAIKRIVADVNGGGPEAVAGLEAMAASGEVNLRCWALEALGRVGNRRSLDVLRKSARDADWRIRAAGILAIGRIAAVRYDPGLGRLISDGMDDKEPVYTHKNIPQRPGQGGGVGYYLPVAMGSLRAAARLSDSGGLEVVLKGLEVRPFVERQFDTTPEPFPDIVTEWAPSWYVNEASGICDAYGERALASLLGMAERAEHRFAVTGGGRHNVDRHALMMSLQSVSSRYASTHRFAVGHIERLAGRAGTIKLLIARSKGPADKAANVLHALSLMAEEDEAIGEIVRRADDALFLEAVSDGPGGALKKNIHAGLIVERLLRMLKVQNNSAAAYRVPMLLAGIDDDRVRAGLAAIIPVGGGNGLMAAQRGVGAISALGRIGNRDSLTLLKSLKTVGDMSADEPWIRAAIDRAVGELESRLRQAKK